MNVANRGIAELQGDRVILISRLEVQVQPNLNAFGVIRQSCRRNKQRLLLDSLAIQDRCGTSRRTRRNQCGIADSIRIHLEQRRVLGSQSVPGGCRRCLTLQCDIPVSIKNDRRGQGTHFGRKRSHQHIILRSIDGMVLCDRRLCESNGCFNQQRTRLGRSSARSVHKQDQPTGHTGCTLRTRRTCDSGRISRRARGTRFARRSRHSTCSSGGSRISRRSLITGRTRVSRRSCIAGGSRISRRSLFAGRTRVARGTRVAGGTRIARRSGVAHGARISCGSLSTRGSNDLGFIRDVTALIVRKAGTRLTIQLAQVRKNLSTGNQHEFTDVCGANSRDTRIRKRCLIGDGLKDRKSLSRRALFTRGTRHS